MWSRPSVIQRCLSSVLCFLQGRLTSCQNCVRALTCRQAPCPSPAARQQGLSLSLTQHEIPGGKFQLLGITVSIASQPKGGACIPLWILTLHFGTYPLCRRSPMLRAQDSTTGTYCLLRCSSLAPYPPPHPHPRDSDHILVSSLNMVS